MGDEPQHSKVTTESSQAVLKAVAGRLAKIDAGEMSAIQFVGKDGSPSKPVTHTGEVAAVPGPLSPPPPAPRSTPQPAAQPAAASDVDRRPSPAPATQDRWVPKAALPAEEPPRDSWWTRLLRKLGMR